MPNIQQVTDAQEELDDGRVYVGRGLGVNCMLRLRRAARDAF